MIFVTVGSLNYDFKRLFEYIDHLIEKNVIAREDVFAQIGYTSYIPKHFKFVSQMNRNDFEKHIQNADIVISHAGTGSTISSLIKDKKLILVPREEQYEEHIDDHQLELIKICKDKNYAFVARTENELQICLNNINNHQFAKFQSNTDNFIKRISKIIEEIK